MHIQSIASSIPKHRSLAEAIPVFGDGSTARDYTFINDILDGVIACTHKEFGYEIFNLGESETVRLSHLIYLLEQALGQQAVIERLPLHLQAKTEFEFVGRKPLGTVSVSAAASGLAR